MLKVGGRLVYDEDEIADHLKDYWAGVFRERKWSGQQRVEMEAWLKDLGFDGIDCVGLP